MKSNENMLRRSVECYRRGWSWVVCRACNGAWWNGCDACDDSGIRPVEPIVPKDYL